MEKRVDGTVMESLEGLEKDFLGTDTETGVRSLTWRCR